MKITLHKPQREAVNAVLAYDGEDEDWVLEFEDTNTDNWYCGNTGYCQYKHDAGDCLMRERWGVTNGDAFYLRACRDWI